MKITLLERRTKFDRKQLAKLIGRLGIDDVLIVTRLDRLAGRQEICSPYLAQ